MNIRSAATLKQFVLLSCTVILSACSDDGPSPGQPQERIVTGSNAPFAVKPDPDATLPTCQLPLGTIGFSFMEHWLLPNNLPLPDRGNQLSEGDISIAPSTLPKQVFLRTDTESFNRRYQFGLREGRLWYKSNTAVTNIKEPWAILPLPECLAGSIIGISVDDHELIAIRADGTIYGMDNALQDSALFNWSSRWGATAWTGSGFHIPYDYRAWSWSVMSPGEDQNWIDSAGNQHAVLPPKVSHIWILDQDGQQLTYMDPWLPKDYSYGMCGPHRGRFRAVNLSASGSVIFVINRYGDMYTRIYDFDLSGANSLADDYGFLPFIFEYSYEDQSNASTPSIQLPPADWVQQPKIDGQITHNIGIHKAGINMETRMLRVEGVGPAGHTGYWEKDYGDIAPNAWIFHRSDHPLVGTTLDNRLYDSSLDIAGPTKDVRYSRNMGNLAALTEHEQVDSDDDWAAELLDFNVYCSPTTLRIHLSKTEQLDLVLHTTDTVRQATQPRGLSEIPRSFRGAIEIPAQIHANIDTLPQKSREFIQHYLNGNRFTEVKLTGVASRIGIDTFGWEFN